MLNRCIYRRCQHIVYQGVNYFAVGSSSDKRDAYIAPPYPATVSGAGVKTFNVNTGIFAVVQAYGKTMQLTAVSETGLNIYCVTLNSTRIVNDFPTPTSTPAPTKVPTSAPTSPTAAPTPVSNHCNLLFSAPNNGLNFLMFGDWGTGNPGQYSVANQMSVTSLQVNATFGISLGDNFYIGSSPAFSPSNDHSGVVNQTDPSWFNKYYNVYTGKGNQIPWYAVLGNHDYGRYVTGTPTSAKAQIDHSKIDKRWNMPDHNFTKTVVVPGSGGKHLQLVFIDTPRLSPTDAPGTSVGNVYGITAAKQASMQAQHLAWVKQTLAASTATWLLVIGHYNSELCIIS